MNWTDERVELLKKLWTEDGLTATQIAQQLGGITRNAVIGKVHRLGLSGRAKSASQAPRAARPKQKSTGHVQRTVSSRPISFGATALKIETEAQIDVIAQPAVMIPFPAPTNDKIDITQLGFRTCRWPIGDPVATISASAVRTVPTKSLTAPIIARLPINRPMSAAARRSAMSAPGCERATFGRKNVSPKRRRPQAAAPRLLN